MFLSIFFDTAAQNQPQLQPHGCPPTAARPATPRRGSDVASGLVSAASVVNIVNVVIVIDVVNAAATRWRCWAPSPSPPALLPSYADVSPQGPGQR